MNVVFSFVGHLPNYIIDIVYQTRLFFNGDIYLIINHINSSLLSNPVLKNVKVIKYDDVKSAEFDQQNRGGTFNVMPELGHRRELFARSFERFYLLQNAMLKFDIKDVLFLELDNMIYDNPENWLPEFSKYDICYMVDNVDRCSSGIMYVKSPECLLPLLEFGLEYVEKSRGQNYINEMTMLYRFYMKNVRDKSQKIQILPTFWRPIEGVSVTAFPAGEHFDKYNSIFDSLPMGVFLCGIDKFHSGGVLELGRVADWSKINYSKFKFVWKEDDAGRKIPFVIAEDGREIRINNLHIHSKELHLGASKPLLM